MHLSFFPVLQTAPTLCNFVKLPRFENLLD